MYLLKLRIPFCLIKEFRGFYLFFISLDNIAVLGLATLKMETRKDEAKEAGNRAVSSGLFYSTWKQYFLITWPLWHLPKDAWALSFLIYFMLLSFNSWKHKLQRSGPLSTFSTLVPIPRSVSGFLVSTYIFEWMKKRCMYKSVNGEDSLGKSRLDKGGQIRAMNGYISVWLQWKVWHRRGLFPTLVSWFSRSVLRLCWLEKGNMSLPLSM